MATELAKAYVQIVPSAQGISGKISEALGGEASSAGAKAGNSVAGSLGKALKGALVKLGIGKMILDSIGNASEFETGMAKVSTLFTGEGDELDALGDKLLELSGKYGLSANTLTEAAYSAESAGVQMDDLGAILDNSAKLAMAGFTDVDTALSATVKTMNAYGESGSEAIDKVSKVLMQTQNLGITTVGELGASLANVTPTAAAMGVGIDQVGAALAQMTAAGVPTAQATTQLRAAMTELGKKGTSADKAFRKAAKGTKFANMSFQEAIAGGANLGDVFGLMQNYANKSGKSMVDLWGSVEAGNAAMMIAKDLDKFNGNLEKMGTDADVVGDAYGKMSDTFGNSMNRLKESAKNFVTALFTGGDISKSFDGMLKGLGDVGKKLITWLSTGLKTLGENLPDLMKKLVDFAGSLIESLGEVDWLEVATTLITGLIGAAGALGTGIVNLITGAIDSLCGGGEGGEGGEGGNNFADLGGAILGGITSVLDAGGQWLATLFGAGKSAVEGIDFGSLGTTIFTSLTNVLDAGGEFLSSLFQTGLESAKGQEWPSIGEAIKTGVNLALNYGQFLGAIFEAGAQLIQAIDWGGVGTSMGNLITTALDAATDIVSAVGGAAADLLTGVDWSGIGKSAGELVTAGIKGAANIVTAVAGGAAKLVTGIQWKNIGQDASKLLSAGLQGSADLLKTGFEGAVTFLEGVNWAGLGATISEGLGNVFGGLGELLGGTLSGAGKAVEGGGEFVGSAFSALAKLISGGDNAEKMKQAAEELKTAMGEMKSALETGKTESVEIAKGIGSGIYTSITTEASKENMKSVGQEIIDGICSGMSDTTKLTKLAQTVTGRVSDIKTTFNGVKGSWESIGKNIVDGIVKGVKANASKLKTEMETLAKEALKAAKDVLGIASPSRVMQENVGRWIPAGIAAGIRQYGGLVNDAMGTVTDSLSSTTIKTTLTDQSSGAYASRMGVGFDGLSSGIASMETSASRSAAEQNELLREQNRLLRAILGRTGTAGIPGASVALGRTVNRSLEMLQMVGG